MRCFNHSDVQAVGLCKHCNRALCHECANDLGFSLACRGVHESEVTTSNDMVKRAARAQTASRFIQYLVPLVAIAGGSLLIGNHLYMGHRGAGLGLWLGGFSIAYGLYFAVVVRRIWAKA